MEHLHQSQQLAAVAVKPVEWVRKAAARVVVRNMQQVVQEHPDKEMQEARVALDLSGVQLTGGQAVAVALALREATALSVDLVVREVPVQFGFQHLQQLLRLHLV